MFAVNSHRFFSPDGAKKIHLALGLLALLVLWWGWLQFWFLTDDAYITFRYISNRQLGFGYVWNAPPFRPVEGYSNFLWMVLLDAVWTWFRVDPPNSANVLSLVFSGLSTWRVWRWAGQLNSGNESPLERALRVLFTLVLLLSNRTFLAWSSSGLETALFGCLQLLWFETLWKKPTDGGGWLCLWASLSALTRPDGLLAWASSIFLFVLPGQGYRSWKSKAFSITALMLVPLHFVFRYATYREWLPNTYYAKHVGAWPEAGIRYLGSFVLEYGYWVLIVLALGWVVQQLRQRFSVSRELFGKALAVGTMVAHTGYYVVRVGGDHFEYRVLAQTVPLLALVWAWLVFASVRRPAARIGWVVLSLWASLPIPWVHYAMSQERTTRENSAPLKLAVAPALHGAMGPIAGWFDALQSELIDHSVGLRHQEHKIFGETQRRFFSVRRPVEPGTAGIPVMSWGTVGVPGWVLPNVAFIDLFGLNDYVIARNPVAPNAFRVMAHDRRAPPGYADCFRPNAGVVANSGLPYANARETPLTADEVRACERTWAEKIGLKPPPD